MKVWWNLNTISPGNRWQNLKNPSKEKLFFWKPFSPWKTNHPSFRIIKGILYQSSSWNKRDITGVLSNAVLKTCCSIPEEEDCDDWSWVSLLSPESEAGEQQENEDESTVIVLLWRDKEWLHTKNYYTNTRKTKKIDETKNNRESAQMF